MKSLNYKAGKKTIALLMMFIIAATLSFLIRKSTWQTDSFFHTLLELPSVFLSLMVGVLAFVRYYSKKSDAFLFLAVGFVGTSLFDFYHAMVSIPSFKYTFPSASQTITAWSWTAGRFFLSVLMVMSWYFGSEKSKNNSKNILHENSIYLSVCIFALLVFIFFIFIPLPQVLYPGLKIPRPYELIPAFLFLTALFGYLKKGYWKANAMEFWLVLSLVAGFLCQALFMSFSSRLFDAMFDAAHLSKHLSYICVLIGLLISIFELYKENENYKFKIEQTNLKLIEDNIKIEKVKSELKINLENLSKQRQAILSLMQDINQARNKERDARNFLEVVIENSPLALILVNKNGEITLTNSSASTCFGYEKEELLGMSVEALVPHEYKASHPKLRSDYFKKPTTKTMGLGRELFGLRKDGTKFDIEIGLNPVETNDGFYVLGTILNITERKKAEEKLQKINAELLRSNKELEQFAYVASHDLQEPLRKITSFSDLLIKDLEGKLTDETKRYFHFMTDAAARMSELIRDLLDFSRAGSKEIDKENIDLNQTLKTVLENLELAIKDNKAKVTFDHLPEVKCSKIFMSQVFQNLISNAIKFKKEKVHPVVHISCERFGNFWAFKIEDNGIGIDKKYAERVFEIFQRLHRKEQFTGTGIGLAICKRIIERHGGRIWIESKLNEGSQFYFTLPF